MENGRFGIWGFLSEHTQPVVIFYLEIYKFLEPNLSVSKKQNGGPRVHFLYLFVRTFSLRSAAPPLLCWKWYCIMSAQVNGLSTCQYSQSL